MKEHEPCYGTSFPSAAFRNRIERAQVGARMYDYYSVAARSFQENLDRIEKDGRKESPDWYLANGLLRLVQGLQQDREAEADRRKLFARSWPARK